MDRASVDADTLAIRRAGGEERSEVAHRLSYQRGWHVCAGTNTKDWYLTIGIAGRHGFTVRDRDRGSLSVTMSLEPEPHN